MNLLKVRKEKKVLKEELTFEIESETSQCNEDIEHQKLSIKTEYESIVFLYINTHNRSSETNHHCVIHF